MKKTDITPIDGCMEYCGHYIFLEYKPEGAATPDRQQLTLEQLTDDLARAGKQAWVALCSNDADRANAAVLAVYWRGNWSNVKEKNYSVNALVEMFLSWIDEINTSPFEFEME